MHIQKTLKRLVAISTLFASSCFANAGPDAPDIKSSCPGEQVRQGNSSSRPKETGATWQEVNVNCGGSPVLSSPASAPNVATPKIEKSDPFDFIKLIDALSRLLGSIAWPAAATLIGFSFRSELRGLFGRLESLKYKDAEAKFNKQLLEAEQSAPPVSSQAKDEWQEASVRGMFTQYEQIRRIAEISPRAAILEAWIDVEVAIYAAAKRAGLEVKGPANTYLLVRNLVSLEKISKDILPFFERLRKLRNEAAHLPDFVLDQVEADKYLDLALGLANTFREYATSNEG